MIRTIDIRLNAAHPELPLPEATTYQGAPSTAFLRGVPKACGQWQITAVSVAVTFPDNSTTTRAAVLSAGDVWVVTIPACATSGRTISGLRILADGLDENGDAVTGYVLGVADLAVATFDIAPAPGETSYALRYFDNVPNPPHKGDVAKVGNVLKYYDGTAWQPFAAAPSPSTSAPLMDGATSAGSSAAYARGDHRHPTDTTRMAATATGADIPVSGTDATKISAALAGKATKADATLTERGDPSTPGFTAWELDYSGASTPGPIDRIAWSGYIWTAVLQRVCGASKDDLAAYTTVTWAPGEWGSSTTSPLVGTWTGDHWEPSITEYDGYPLVIFGGRDYATPAQEMTGGVAGKGGSDPNALELQIDVANTWPSSGGSGTAVATRTAVQGYQLGTQTDKPLASEAEAEALRTGKADRADNPTAGNLAALDANGNPTNSGIAAGNLLTIVTLADSTETMASILARLNAINAARQHVFFDCSGIDVNPRLYLCTIMIDADANAVRVYDQVTGKLYIGPYDAAETIGEVFAKAVDAYHSITVSAVTLDGVTVTGQTVTIREGTDATAPVYATATITDGAPVVFVVPKGMIYFLEITDALADHFGPRVTSGARQGIATADAAVTFTYYDAEHIDVSEITTFAKLQEALTWFGTNESAARNNLVGIEIADTWTATNGTVYDNPRVVWDVHYFEDESGASHLGALMGTKYCSHNDVQFDAAEGEECDSSTETVAEADVYYYGLALGETSKTAANLTLLELSEGDELPYADYAKIYKSAIRDTTRNSLQYGYNNWRDSAYRQYLNSDAAAGQWWGATHIGDIAPSQLNSVRGFMAGCSAALLAAAKKVKVATWPNSVTDGPNQITTLYETLDTFFLPSGSEVYGNVNESGGASVEGELSPYWRARTGYTAPNNAATSTRIIYRELPVDSTANRSAATVRLRSAYRGNSYAVWYVSTSGQVYYGYTAGSAYASVPACVIY